MDEDSASSAPNSEAVNSDSPEASPEEVSSEEASPESSPPEEASSEEASVSVEGSAEEGESPGLDAAGDTPVDVEGSAEEGESPGSEVADGGVEVSELEGSAEEGSPPGAEVEGSAESEHPPEESEESSEEGASLRGSGEADDSPPGASEEESSVLDPLVIGRYHAKKLLGETDTGRIYEGWDAEDGREVLLCLLEPDVVPVDDIEDRLLHLSRLEHLHILPLLDWNLEPVPHLVYQFEGVSLRRIMDAGVSLSLSQVLLLGLQASETLDGLVSGGITHGALWPENFMVDAGGRLHLAGMGAFCFRRPPSPQGQSDPDRYAAPETSGDPSAAPGEVSEVDQAAADVYSLALVLAEAAAGEWVSPQVLSLMGSGQLPAEDEEKTRALGPLAPLFIQAVASDFRERPSAGEFALALRSTAELLPPPKRFDEIIETLSGEADLPAQAVEGDDEEDEQKAPRRLAAVVKVAAASIVLVLGTGLLLLFAARGDSTPTYEVPDVVGMNWSEAEALLRETGWEPRRLEVRVAGSEPDEVTAQLPDGGELLDEGQVVKVQVSLGDPLVVVPLDLLGIPLPEARLRLSAIGLQVGGVSSRVDAELPEGTVLKIDEPSIDVPRGSQVDLVVSTRG